MTEKVKIKADIMWAYLERENEMSGRYQVDLCNLSQEAVGALQEMGISVHEKEDKGHFITCKSTNPIKAYDYKGEQLEGVIVANGSKAVATVGYYDWKYQKKSGRSPSIIRLVIEELVEYQVEDSGDAL